MVPYDSEMTVFPKHSKKLAFTEGAKMGTRAKIAGFTIVAALIFGAVSSKMYNEKVSSKPVPTHTEKQNTRG